VKIQKFYEEFQCDVCRKEAVARCALCDRDVCREHLARIELGTFEEAGILHDLIVKSTEIRHAAFPIKAATIILCLDCLAECVKEKDVFCA